MAVPSDHDERAELPLSADHDGDANDCARITMEKLLTQSITFRLFFLTWLLCLVHSRLS
jgi:hypothetical protein